MGLAGVSQGHTGPLGLVALPEDRREGWDTSAPDMGAFLHGTQKGVFRGLKTCFREEVKAGVSPALQDVPGCLRQDPGGGLGPRRGGRAGPKPGAQG